MDLLNFGTHGAVGSNLAATGKIETPLILGEARLPQIEIVNRNFCLFNCQPARCP